MRSVTNLGPLSLWQCLTHKLRSTYRYQAHCVVLHTVLFLSFPNASCAYIYDIYIYCIHLESQIWYDYKLWTNKRKEKNQRSTTSGHSRPKPSWGVEDGDEGRNSSLFFHVCHEMNPAPIQLLDLGQVLTKWSPVISSLAITVASVLGLFERFLKNPTKLPRRLISRLFIKALNSSW